MADQRAKEIVALRDREKARQQNFRNLWQSVADLMFPQTYGITTQRSPGWELMQNLWDTTAVEELENMTSGLVTNLFPAGQPFFSVVPMGEIDDYDVKRYLSTATEKTHEEMFNSNFIEQCSNTVKYWAGFGTGALYSDWTVADGLSYRDYSVGTYQCLENSRGLINTIIVSCPMTARQIVEKFGENSGEAVLKANGVPESCEDVFEVIHIVRPRKEYDESEGVRRADRMPFESLYVQEKDQIILEEGGFDEFPFVVPRYEVMYREVYGRGRGTMMLPQVRTINRLAKDYLEMSNKWVNSPKEVLESFDGEVDVTPGALNYVSEMGSIKAIDMGANGMYPVTKDILEYHRETIRQGFFKNAFEPITPLSGDRRNTTEIIERLKEGMKRLSKPLGRLFTEFVTPLVTRSALLLIRNGVIPPPPEALQGTPLKIELINPLALALRDQQSRGLQMWVTAGANMEQTFPGITDNVDADKAFRDLGISFGVKTDHIRPVRERDQMRKAEAEAAQAQQEMAAQMANAQTYKDTAKAPDDGSPAQQLTGA